MTDTPTVRMVVLGLILTVLVGMTIEGILINRLVGAPPEQVKEIAIVMLAFAQLPSGALGALSAVLVSTRSAGTSGDGGTVDAQVTVSNAPLEGGGA